MSDHEPSGTNETANRSAPTRKVAAVVAGGLAVIGGLSFALVNGESATLVAGPLIYTSEGPLKTPSSTATSSTSADPSNPADNQTTTTSIIFPTTSVTRSRSDIAADVENEFTVIPADETAPQIAVLLEGLRTLVIEPDPARSDYDRDLFFERGDLDGDCIDTRHEVLQEEAISFEMSINGCSVTVGEWWDPFTGASYTDPGDLQLDHVVALADAWRSLAGQPVVLASFSHPSYPATKMHWGRVVSVPYLWDTVVPTLQRARLETLGVDAEAALVAAYQSGSDPN